MIYGPLAPIEDLELMRVGQVVLEVTVSDRLIRFDLFNAIDGMADFVATFRPSFEFLFEIRKHGVSSLGYGQLSMES